MLAYLDSSALVKLVVPEDGSSALFDALEAWPERVSSAVAAVEVPRAIHRTSVRRRAIGRMEQVLARIGLVDLDASIRDRAAGLRPTELRALDAIHVATAMDLEPEIGVFITYDERQSHAARAAGLSVLSPR